MRLSRSRLSKGKHIPSGFTLLEVLIATALLALVSMMLVQIMNGLRGGAAMSEKRVDATAQAQLVFDVLARDLEAMPVRADIPSVMQNVATNAVTLNFVSLIQSPNKSGILSGSRKLSSVAYRVAPDAFILSTSVGKPTLQRAALGQDWNTVGLWGIKGTLSSSTFSGTPITTADWPSSATAVASDYDTLSEAVLRMGLNWQLREASGSNARGALLASPPVDSAGNPDLTKVGSLTVTLVLIDLSSRKLAKVSQLEDIASKFSAPVNNQSAYSMWQPIAESLVTDTSLASIPLPVRQNVRVFQRTFLIPPAL